MSDYTLDKTVTSNSCVGYFLYVNSKVPHLTPLIGSLFLDDFMYLKFLENYDRYMSLTPEFIEKYDRNIKLKGHTEVAKYYVLMKIDDIEIHWIHESSSAVVLSKWNRRLDRSFNKERFSIWTTSEFMQIHDDVERKELINRYCNLPEYTILLTERKEEEIYEKNHAIIFIPQWENKSQTDRHMWGFLRWNDQDLQIKTILNFLRTK